MVMLASVKCVRDERINSHYSNNLAMHEDQIYQHVVGFEDKCKPGTCPLL